MSKWTIYDENGEFTDEALRAIRSGKCDNPTVVSDLIETGSIIRRTERGLWEITRDGFARIEMRDLRDRPQSRRGAAYLLTDGITRKALEDMTAELDALRTRCAAAEVELANVRAAWDNARNGGA